MNYINWIRLRQLLFEEMLEIPASQVDHVHIIFCHLCGYVALKENLSLQDGHQYTTGSVLIKGMPPFQEFHLMCVYLVNLTIDNILIESMSLFDCVC